MYIVVNSYVVKIIFNIIIYCIRLFYKYILFLFIWRYLIAAMLLFNLNVEIKFIYPSIYTTIIFDKDLLHYLLSIEKLMCLHVNWITKNGPVYFFKTVISYWSYFLGSGYSKLY